MNISKRYLTKSEMTRPKEKLYIVENILLGELKMCDGSAIHARNYIESLSRQQDIYLSYHYIIDQTGKILQIIPEDEIAYPTTDIDINTRSIGICLVSEQDKKQFSNNSINAQISLIQMLIKKYNLNFENLLTCYDVNMKRIPREYVDNLIVIDDLKNRVNNKKEYI